MWWVAPLFINLILLAFAIGTTLPGFLSDEFLDEAGVCVGKAK